MVFLVKDSLKAKEERAGNQVQYCLLFKAGRRTRDMNTKDSGKRPRRVQSQRPRKWSFEKEVTIVSKRHYCH
jgi:hypothetical protein